MRHWFLVIMIALLPLRGWVSDAMAVEMLASPAHASMALDVSSAGHADEPMAAHGGHGDHDNSPDSDDDHRHNACEVCNGPALAMAMLPASALPLVHNLLTLPAERFASTEAQRGIKPPIS